MKVVCQLQGPGMANCALQNARAARFSAQVCCTLLQIVLLFSSNWRGMQLDVDAADVALHGHGGGGSAQGAPLSVVCPVVDYVVGLNRLPEAQRPNAEQLLFLQEVARYIEARYVYDRAAHGPRGPAPAVPKLFLHGGPGTGKSFCVHHVQAMAAVAGYGVACTSPAGVAAAFGGSRHGTRAR